MGVWEWIFTYLIGVPLFLWFFFSLLFGKLGGVSWGKTAQRELDLQAARKQARRDAEDRLIRRYRDGR